MIKRRNLRKPGENKHTRKRKKKEKKEKLNKTAFPCKKKPHLEYTHGYINKIRNSVEDWQSWLTWPTVNEDSRKKSILRAKLKVASQEEKIEMERTFLESAWKLS